MSPPKKVVDAPLRRGLSQTYRDGGPNETTRTSDLSDRLKHFLRLRLEPAGTWRIVSPALQGVIPMQSRDAVLEGANPSEIAALSRLCDQSGYVPPPDLAGRLQAKGWLDRAGDDYLLTIAGRTLIEKH